MAISAAVPCSGPSEKSQLHSPDARNCAEGQSAASTRDGLEMLKACLDQLWTEGETTGRIMNFGLHPHVIGQPHRIAALADFLAYVKSKTGIWMPKREELAQWYLSVHADHIPP